MDLQGVFFDGRTRPNLGQQLVLCDKLTLRFDQNFHDFESSATKGDRSPPRA